jgi:hypothetical protein
MREKGGYVSNRKSLLSMAEAATHLGITVEEFKTHVRLDVPAVRVGGRNRWDRFMLTTWSSGREHPEARLYYSPAAMKLGRHGA